MQRSRGNHVSSNVFLLRCLLFFLPVFMSIFGLSLLGPPLAAFAEDAGPVLDRSAFPAAGRHDSHLKISRFGRYSVTVESEQGVALQYVDKMEGPGPVQGYAGETDGRLDLFLDRGEYKVVAMGHERAEGEAALAVHSFTELNDPAPQLVELKPVKSSLNDFEQVSYWILLKARKVVYLEAAGRNLADLRIWKDGSWLVDAVPTTEVLDPIVGKPLLACRLVVDLEPGLYRATAYGGAGQPWAEDNGRHPFYLRWGIPKLSIAGRSRRVVGPLGLDRWLVPAKANYFRLELPEAKPAALRVGSLNERNPFNSVNNTATIDKNSRVPVAEINNYSGSSGWKAVTVRADAGEPYILQHFEASHEYHFQESGNYWVSTVHSGHAADSVDATGILVNYSRGNYNNLNLAASQTIEIDSSKGWSRRCNLLEHLTVFFHVRESGSYRVDMQGADASHRFQPFLLNLPRDYKAPEYRGAGSIWDLDAGYYVLEVSPKSKGIVDIAVSQKDIVDKIKEFAGASAGVSPHLFPFNASVRFPSLNLAYGDSYVLHLNQQPEVKTGVVLRKLPLDLTEALPVSLSGGESLEVQFKAAEEGSLFVIDETGARFPFWVDGDKGETVMGTTPGLHSLKFMNNGKETAQISASFVPTRLTAQYPLPPLPDAVLTSLPDFPVISETEPRYFDLGRNSNQTFLLKAGDSALYRLETTGLLDTSGTVRSRVITSLAASGGGGSGRNFFLHQYLLSGDYQTTVSTAGRSAGHLGLTLTRTDPIDGGELAEGIAARVKLDASQAIVYRFTVKEAGEYRLRTLGRNRGFICRIEDFEGWPLEKPGGAADISRRFEPGEYRFVLLPDPVESRRVTLLERLRPPPSFEGRGPHELPLAVRVKHLWTEPGDAEAGGERTPDSWEFFLPSATNVRIDLTSRMQGILYAVDPGKPEKVAEIYPDIGSNKGWSGALEKGRYRVEAVCSRVDNRVSYEIEVKPEALLPGLSRQVRAPATVPVSLGEAGLLEIGSFGASDVKAKLFDANGTLIAANDDQESDWNFHVAAAVEPGRYSLEIAPSASGSADTVVTMETRSEIRRDPISSSGTMEFQPGIDVHIFPLSPSLLKDADLLVVSAASAETVGLIMEEKKEEEKPGGAWKTLASRSGSSPHIELALPASGQIRVRAWSVDKRDNPLELRVGVLSQKAAPEELLAKGTALSPVSGSDMAAGLFSLDRPGSLVLESGRSNTFFASAPGRTLEPARNGNLPCAGERLWLSRPLDEGALEAKASRVVLGDNGAGGDALKTSVDERGPVFVELKESKGPVLVIVSAMAGQPGVAIVDSDSASGLLPSVTATAVAENRSAAVRLSNRRSSALVWSASGLPGAFDVRITRFAFASPSPETIDFGVVQGTLMGREAKTFSLPAGAKTIRLSASPGVVAAVAEGNDVESVHWAGEKPLAEFFETKGRSLFVFSTNEAEARFEAEILPSGGDGPGLSLKLGDEFDSSAVRAETWRFKVPSGPGFLYFSGGAGVSGLGRAPTFVGADGTVSRGFSVPVGEKGGYFLAPAEPGRLTVQMGSGSAGEGDAGWDLVKLKKVSLPSVIALEGGSQGFRIATDSPSLLHVSIDAGVSARFSAGKGKRRWSAPSGGVFNAYAPAGEAALALRGVEGNPLSGTMTLSLTPITEIDEGLGPKALLSPGMGRAFSFSIARKGRVGVGVRSDSGSVEGELMTSDGKSIGRAIVQMHELEAGTYVLILTNPPEAGPVTAQPAAVGIRQPSLGPPEEVLRTYLHPGEEALNSGASQGAGTYEDYSDDQEYIPEGD